jgi:feruloyl esterase
MYHGWSDGLIPAQNSIDYFESVLAREKAGSRTDALQALRNDVRLFMVPGMDHCGGGRGANQFDGLAALERWVEQGEAPATIEARGTTLTGQPLVRKLCPYPQVARYDGRGDPNRAESFECRSPSPEGRGPAALAHPALAAFVHPARQGTRTRSVRSE